MIDGGLRAPRPGEDGQVRLATECWCRRLIVWVPQPDVVAGLTGHCRRWACVQVDRSERARQATQQAEARAA